MTLRHQVLRACASAPARPFLRPFLRGRACVFMLHRLENPGLGVRGISVAQLRDHIRRMRRSGARFVSLRDLVDAALAGGPVAAGAVAITIDDGFADQANLARAIRDEGVPVTIFLISGLIDGEIWPWDDQLEWVLANSEHRSATVEVGGHRLAIDLSSPENTRQALTGLEGLYKRAPQSTLYADIRQLGERLGVDLPRVPPPAFRPMTWDVARDLESKGVDFAPHSVTHRIFSCLGDEEASRELVESRRRLAEELRRPLDIFGWPTGRHGDFTERDIRLAREAGFRAAFATDHNYAVLKPAAGDAAWPFTIKRFGLGVDVDEDEVLSCVTGAKRLRQLLTE